MTYEDINKIADKYNWKTTETEDCITLEQENKNKKYIIVSKTNQNIFINIKGKPTDEDVNIIEASLDLQRTPIKDRNSVNKFKKARLEAGLTVIEMENKLQIPRRTIYDWESGRRKPPEYTKRMVLELLNNIKIQNYMIGKESLC